MQIVFGCAEPGLPLCCPIKIGNASTGNTVGKGVPLVPNIFDEEKAGNHPARWMQ
jgi:hypothetical protein